MTEILFRSWPETKGKKTKFFLNLMLISFIFGNLMIIIGIVIFIWDRLGFCSIIIPIINIHATLLVGRIYFAKMNRELWIYKNGILIPIGFPRRKLIPFLEISQINLYIKEEKNYIEFKLQNEMKLIYPKFEIEDWKEFCRVLDKIKDDVNIEE